MESLARDEDILKAAEDWRKQGRGVALATVVETWGSAPRPVGSNLVIDDEGNFLGSVSGGCVEGAVVTEAIDVIESGKPQDARIRRRRRDRLEGRSLLRRHDPGLRREGGLMMGWADGLSPFSPRRRGPRATRRKSGSRLRGDERVSAVMKLDILSPQRRARRAACRRRRHRRWRAASSAWSRPPTSRAIRSPICSRSTSAAARAAWRRRRRARSSSPCTCRRRGSSSPAPCTSARRWRRSPSCSATTSPSSIRAPRSPPSSAFPTSR